jgi:membrane-bound metal-dependent hydrolase YbcI (DUF457 family)
MGAIVPDLEIPFYFVLTGNGTLSRGFMHSLLGAVTIDLVVGSLLAVTVVPWFILKLRGREYWGKFLRFYATPRTASRDVVMASVALGALSHAVLDLFTHAYNPILWPFPVGTEGLLLLGDLVLSLLLVHAVLVGPFVWLLWRPAARS